MGAVNDYPEHLPLRNADSGFSLADCALQSHDCCDAKVCEVRHAAEILGAIRQGQIKITVATGIAGIVISSVFALALIGVWWHHAIQGHPMPDVPWFVLSVALVPFGSALVMKVPKND